MFCEKNQQFAALPSKSFAQMATVIEQEQESL